MARTPRIGVIGYTNLASGIGIFTHELWRAFGDSIFSVSADIKGQERWAERQATVSRPPTMREIVRYLDEFEPEVVVYIETPFSHHLFPIAKEAGVKVVGIMMHEFFGRDMVRGDLVICPSFSAWEKAKGEKALLFLPISLELFPYRERTGHTFLVNVGYGSGLEVDRRQTWKIIEAFCRLDDPRARLVVHSQMPRPGIEVDDDRITYEVSNLARPADVYDLGDILIAVSAYGGYERTILEGMACGLPVLTTDADPMNLFQHDPDFLVPPAKRWMYNEKWISNTVYNEISVDDLEERMRWLLTIDTAKYSRRARAQAEAQSWESKDIDYRGAWLKVLSEA